MFNFFKKTPKELEIYAPMDGTVLPLSASPDEAFAQGMLGEGVCIEPSGDTVYSPIKGKVETFHTLHAVGCKAENDVELIVHVGMNTVDLKGEGFKALAPLEGDVEVKTPLISFDKDFLIGKVGTVITPIIVVSKPDTAKLEIVKSSGDVKAGELIMKIIF